VLPLGTVKGHWWWVWRGIKREKVGGGRVGQQVVEFVGDDMVWLLGSMFGPVLIAVAGTGARFEIELTIFLKTAKARLGGGGSSPDAGVLVSGAGAMHLAAQSKIRAGS
jgi:hypothetical protein